MKSLLLPLCLLSSIAMAHECRHEAARDLDIPRQGAKVIAFDLASADIEIEGATGLAGIEVRGRACARDEARLADITLDQRREGDRIVVFAREERRPRLSWNDNTGLRLTVRVPKDLAVRIESVSGDARVHDVASLDFHATSGDLVLRDVPGPVTLRLSSGDVRAERVGPLDVERMSSGDLTVRDVRGDAHVGAVGSGDIRLSDIHGKASIDGAGSGDITVREVERDVTIGPTGSGDLLVDGVGGDLRLHARHDRDDVRYRNVAGHVTFGRPGTD